MIVLRYGTMSTRASRSARSQSPRPQISFHSRLSSLSLIRILASQSNRGSIVYSMAYSQALQALLLILLGSIVFCVATGRRRTRKFGRPLPMPRGLPIVSNALQLGDQPWIPLRRWSEYLGPIYALNLGGKTVIVLNSYEVASDLLDHRSAIYSNRPRVIVTGEILCGDLAFPFLSHGDRSVTNTLC